MTILGVDLEKSNDRGILVFAEVEDGGGTVDAVARAAAAAAQSTANSAVQPAAMSSAIDAAAGYTDTVVTLSGFTNQSITIRKYASGLVIWRGLVTNDTGASITLGNAIGTIPVGSRPGANMRISLALTTDVALAGIIRPNFTIALGATFTAGSVANFDGVSYIAQN